MRARSACLLTTSLLAVSIWAPMAKAAGPPEVIESWVTDVTATSVKLQAKINPHGLSTTYRFEYIGEAAYQANLGATPPREGFSGAAKTPSATEAAGLAGSGTIPQQVTKSPGGLVPDTAYRYRVIATNSAGVTTGTEHVLGTQEATSAFRLPDNRAWEMVSPVEKGGGAIEAPGTLFGGGEFQAAPGGGALTYSSATAFGAPAGAPPVSQYISTRTTSGWPAQNINTPTDSGAYGDEPDGAPYRLFSTDLSRALLFGGDPCRGVIGCPAPSPPLVGTGAPLGYAEHYLRESATGGFQALIGAADVAHSAVTPEAFEATFAGASPDLSHIVLSSCAALTADATEVPAGPGKCDPTKANFYLRSSGGLSLLNVLPGDTQGTPGAEIAAPIGAVSVDGSRVYWAQGTNLYLREGNTSLQVDESLGGGGSFQAASADGSVAFFTKAGHLYRFLLVSKATTDLTPSGGVVGVLGASNGGDHVYYQDASGLQHWHNGTTTEVAAGVSATTPSDYPPATATARVSPDGSHLAFLSTAELSGYDNDGQAEAYLYGPPVGGGAPQLVCASCNPTGERALGAASIPGALLNGSTRAYRARALSDDGSRLFFGSSVGLVVQDTNNRPDVYQWEAKGAGDCNRSPGCVKLISSGRSPEGASFIDASADGSDAFFITDGSLVGADPGSIDIYDARIGGAFVEAPKPIPCIGDACQGLPEAPDDPDPGTLTPNSGNPAPSIEKPKKKKQKPKKKQQGKGKHKKNQQHKGKGKKR